MKNYFLLFLVVVMFTGCSKSSVLHDSMEEMGDAYKAMRDSSNLETINKEFTDFKAALDMASQQTVKPEHQDTFNEGMDELKTLVKQVDAALAAGDVDKTKQILEKLGDVRKEHHEELGVKKD